MDFENNSQDMVPEQKNETKREDTNPSSGYQREYHAGGKPQRPRIRSQRAYSSDKGMNKEEGFRPEGFGAGLQSAGSQQGAYRSRDGSGNGFAPRGNSYGQRPQGGGYGQQRPQGGYRPRFNNNNEEGGYASRPQGGYGQRPQGGYRPRYNAEEEEGTGFQPRGNSYGKPRQQGGYGQRSQGGYGQRQQGGYGQRPQGGFHGRKPAGGYGQRPQSNYPSNSYRQHSADYDPNAKYSYKKRIDYKEEHVDPNEPIRLNKYLANAGVCSRREADEFIQAGVVTVNGKVVTELGTKVLRSDVIVFHDQPVTIEKKVYVLLNKPKDYVTTVDDPQQRKTVMDLVKNACPERIYPVGRLDRNTMGVLLLTNDGELACKLTHPKFLKKKVYHVFLDKNVTAYDMQKIAEGIQLEDGVIKADAIDYADPSDKTQVGIEIHSGKNRIVRRIFEGLGYHVVKLDRVQFAGLTKKGLRRGDWRYLTEKEVEMLRIGAFE